MLRHFIFAALLVASLIAHSQYGVGDWRVHPYYVDSEVKNIIDTQDQAGGWPEYKASATYANSNMDVIDRDGRVTNVSDIKDAALSSSKGINDVTFASGLMYVATEFGYVIYDAEKLVVKQSHVYGQDISSVTPLGSLLVLEQGGNLRAAPLSGHHESLSSFDLLDPSLPL